VETGGGGGGEGREIEGVGRRGKGGGERRGWWGGRMGIGDGGREGSKEVEKKRGCRGRSNNGGRVGRSGKKPLKVVGGRNRGGRDLWRGWGSEGGEGGGKKWLGNVGRGARW